jgi:hypothetical protein
MDSRPKYNFIKIEIPNNRYIILAALSLYEYRTLDISIARGRGTIIASNIDLSEFKMIAIHNIMEEIQPIDKREFDTRIGKINYQIRNKKRAKIKTTSITQVILAAFQSLNSNYGAIFLISADKLVDLQSKTGYLPDRIDI